MVRALVHLGQNGCVHLPKEEIHHLVRVRRCKVGDVFEALDFENGRVYRCRLRNDQGSWHGVILTTLAAEPDPPVRIILAQALVKKDRFEWVLQKATELGVTEIVPIITCRTEIRLDDKREPRKLERWRKILAEAVKQCGRSRFPLLSSPSTLGALLKERAEAVKIVLDEKADAPLSEVLLKCGSPEECMLFVGPEGGWDEKDRVELVAAKVHPAKLGPRIMRSETASVAALSVLQCILGDFNKR